MKINLDVILDAADLESANKELLESISPFGLTGKVLNLNGPAGGNPEVEIEGEKEALNKYLDFAGFDLI